MRKGRSLAHCASRYHGRRDGSNRKPQRGRGGAGQSSRRPAARGEGRRAARAALRAGPHERRHQDRHAAHGRAGYRAIGSPRAPLRSGRLHPGRHHPERERRAAVREQQLRLFQHVQHSRPRLAVLPRRRPRRLAGQRLSADTDRRGPRGHSQRARLRPLRQRSARRHHQPDLQAPDAHAVLQRHGRRGQLRDLPVRGGPLGETLGYRFNSDYFHTDGFRDVGSTYTEFVPLVVWRPVPGQTLTAKFDFRTIEAVADTVGIPFKGRTLVDIPRDTNLYSPFADTSQDVYRLALKLDSEVAENVLFQQNAVFMQRELALVRNASNPVFAANGVTLTGRSVRDQHDEWVDFIYQAEPIWKVQTGPLDHTILGGFQFQIDLLYTRRQTANLLNITNVYHDPMVPEANMKNLTWVPNFNRNSHLFDYALYLQDQIAFGPQWKWRGGIRWDHFDSFDHDRVSPYVHQLYNDKFSWNVGLAYQPVPDTSFYGGISKSYLSILTSEATMGAALPPESGLQYELGNRSQFLGGLIRANLAIFQTYRKNFLVTIGTNTTPIGEQRSEGVEFDFSSQPLAGWVLWANYAYTTTALMRLSPADPSAGKNHSAQGVPENAAALWTTYEIQSGTFKGFGGGGGFVYKGGVYLDTLNTMKLPQFATGDLVLFYRASHADFQVNIKNISDATYYFAGRNGGGAPGDPVSAFGTVTVNY